MNAKDAATRFKRNIIGCVINTQPFGYWPGGRAEVIDIFPDKNAPDIVMLIESLEGHGYIGILEDEEISIL